MLDLSLKWGGKLRPEVQWGWHGSGVRQFGSVDKISGGDQGGEMRDGKAGTGVSDTLQHILHCMSAIAALNLVPFGGNFCFLPLSGLTFVVRR